MEESFVGWVVSLGISFIFLASIAPLLSIEDFVAILLTLVAGAFAWIYAHS